MSDITLEDLEDLENINLSNTLMHKSRPNIVPALKLTPNPTIILPAQTKPKSKLQSPMHHLSSAQEILLRKKARDIIESHQVQNFENFEKKDLKFNYSVDEILLKAKKNCEKLNITKFFNAKNWMVKHSEPKTKMRKYLKEIPELPTKFQEIPEENFKMKLIEHSMQTSLGEFIKMVQKKNLKVNTVLKDGWNLLLLTAKHNKTEIFEYLVNRELRKKGEKTKLMNALYQITTNGMNILHISIVFSSFDLFKSIIKQIKNLESILNDTFQYSFNSILENTNKKKMTPFLFAINENKINHAKYLAELGCNIWAKNEKLENALHLAFKNKSADLIKLISFLDSDKNVLKSQVDLNKHKPSDLDPSKKLVRHLRHPWDLVQQGKFEIFVKKIDSNKLNIDSTTFRKKNTFLHISIKYHQTAITRYLVNKGANIDLKNYKNQTPLQLALLKGDEIYYNLIQSIISVQSISLPKPKLLSQNFSIKHLYKPLKVSKRSNSTQILLPVLKLTTNNISKHFF